MMLASCEASTLIENNREQKVRVRVLCSVNDVRMRQLEGQDTVKRLV